MPFFIYLFTIFILFFIIFFATSSILSFQRNFVLQSSSNSLDTDQARLFAKVCKGYQQTIKAKSALQTFFEFNKTHNYLIDQTRTLLGQKKRIEERFSRGLTSHFIDIDQQTKTISCFSSDRAALMRIESSRTSLANYNNAMTSSLFFLEIYLGNTMPRHTTMLILQFVSSGKKICKIASRICLFFKHEKFYLLANL